MKEERSTIKMEPDEKISDEIFVEVRTQPWTSNEKTANQKIIDELVTVNTENQRLYFNLQKQRQRCIELEIQLDDLKSEKATDNSQKINKLMNEMDALKLQLNKSRSSESDFKLKYEKQCIQTRAQGIQINSLTRSINHLQAKLRQLECVSECAADTSQLEKSTSKPKVATKPTPPSRSKSSSNQAPKTTKKAAKQARKSSPIAMVVTSDNTPHTTPKSLTDIKCKVAAKQKPKSISAISSRPPNVPPVITSTNTSTTKNMPKSIPAKRKQSARVKTSKNKRTKKQHEFEVEKILEHRTSASGKIFLIRWKGYESDDDTWEAENNLQCPLILKKYFESVNDNPAHNE